MKNYEYKFDDKTRILFKDHFGKFTLNDIKSSWEFAFENNIIPENVEGFILDYRKATFGFDPAETSEIAKFYRENIKYFRHKKVAIIVESPDMVVIPMLFELEDKEYFSHPFFTVEAGIEWILI